MTFTKASVQADLIAILRAHVGGEIEIAAESTISGDLGVGSEPETTQKQDEAIPPVRVEAAADEHLLAVPSPMADLPFGASFGTLHVGGLLAGESYRLAITGNVSGFGNYDVKVGITPVPGAMLLLGPALAGLGFMGFRRSQTA